MAYPRVSYHPRTNSCFLPQPGDIVLFDRVFNGREHDHIGIILETDDTFITVAEGNINNLSGILRRKRDEHIRAYLRIPDGFSYFDKTE